MDFCNSQGACAWEAPDESHVQGYGLEQRFTAAVTFPTAL